MAKKRILVMNGPNLDMLGTREPEVYGRDTLKTLEEEVGQYASMSGMAVDFYQSNSEGKLIGRIHDAPKKYDGIVYNPGAHTHYSYALRDAIGSVDIPVVEVHLSDIDDREPFRRISVIAPACVAQVKGLGIASYCRALDILRSQPGLPRLGEGFELKVSGEQSVIVAGMDGTTEATRADSALQRDLPNVFAVPRDPSKDGAARSETVVPMVAPPVSVPWDTRALSEQRLASVRDACAHMGVGAFLVRDTSNIHWITALDGVFDEEQAHSLLIMAKKAILHTDSRYANAASRALAGAGSPIEVDSERVSGSRFAHDLLTQQGEARFDGKLGIEDTIAYREFAALADLFKSKQLAATKDAILTLRAVKDGSELARMRAAQGITDSAFSHIIGFIKPGMTEREVQLELDGFMLRAGAESLAFPSIVAAGENGADPHAIPGATVLEAGQCVVMDFGAKVDGYCSDMTRTIFLGEPDGDMARAWDALRQANEQIEAMLAPGITGKSAQDACENILASAGFAGTMGHGLGHGVGLDIHELPVLNSKNEQPLVEGNVVTVEPGIYLPGRFGMRLEDCGVVTATGFDVLTQSTHEMVII